MHQLLQFAGPHMKPLSPFSKGSTTLGGKHLESALDRLNFFFTPIFPNLCCLIKFKAILIFSRFFTANRKIHYLDGDDDVKRKFICINVIVILVLRANPGWCMENMYGNHVIC